MRRIFFFYACVLVVGVCFVSSAHGCSSLKDGVCVCTADYCDSIEDVGPLSKHSFVLYSSSKRGDRLARSVHNFSSSVGAGPDNLVFDMKVDPSQKFQKIIGFGGAFTDAATSNFMNVSDSLKTKLLDSYFAEDGLRYSLGRVPMGSCDFSIFEYSYDDSVGDFELSEFSIDRDAASGKLALIQQALAYRNLTLFASPWSPPSWMKNNGNRVGGTLRGQAGDRFHQAWAEYFVRFISSYNEHNISIWAVTVQNEPNSKVWWDSCKFTAEQERDFIKMDLGPKLRAAHPDVKIIMFDDQFPAIPHWTKVILGDEEAAKYVDGIGVHWYTESDIELPLYNYVKEAHKTYPNVFILPTEACEGFLPWALGPKMGDWLRGKHYAHDIIQELLHGASGWTDWNLFLDLQGGPNHANNFVDAAILVDVNNDKFYKQPMYYAMGHFSRFVPSGSVRVELSGSDHIESVAFLVPDESCLVIVLHNQHVLSHQVVNIQTPLGIASVSLESESIATLIVPIQ